MLRKFFWLLALILLVSFSAASAASVIDNAGVLSATEIELLNQRISAIEQEHKIKIGVSFVKGIGGNDMISASNNLLDQHFGNGMNGGIVLLVDMDKRKYEMSTDRRMVERITNYDGIPFLKDKFQSSLSTGNYYNAANSFAEGVDELLTYYETNGVPYGQRSREGFDPMAAGIAAIVSIVLGVFIRSSLIGSMSNIRHAQAAIDYLKKNTVKLTENRDTFLFMNVKRRPKGGGGNRSGGSHGGGGHGGGGGSF